MNDKYNQPTAHMLQPVKGWDSMAHLDFVAPIAKTVEGALPGTVMHLNAAGQLETGLTPQGMGMYLFYKQNDEDVQPYPLTADGTQMTAVGMQSFGGYNSEVYLRHNWINVEKNDYYNTNGTASNVGPFNYNAQDSTPSVAYTKGMAAHTTYPAICGMELSSTEFASAKNNSVNGALGEYVPNTTLTSPTKAKAQTVAYGDAEQKKLGGFLMPGTCYVDPICGIVSKKPVINEHGYKQICFWSCWLPALSNDIPQDGTTLSLQDGKLMWQVSADSSDSDATATATLVEASEDNGVEDPYEVVNSGTITKGDYLFVRGAVSDAAKATGYSGEDVVLTFAVGTDQLVVGAKIGGVKVTEDNGAYRISVDADATAAKVTVTANSVIDTAEVEFTLS